MTGTRLAAVAFGLAFLIAGTTYASDDAIRSSDTVDADNDHPGDRAAFSVSVEPASMIYGAFAGTPRLVTSVGCPLNESVSLETSALVEGSFSEGAEYFQSVFVATLRKSFGSVVFAPYLGAGPSVGLARLFGDDEIWILAGGAVFEAGLRFRPYAGRFFLEPYVGEAFSVGPRFGSGSASFDHTLGAYGGLRIGMLFNALRAGKKE
jgi:hypothetical protein